MKKGSFLFFCFCFSLHYSFAQTVILSEDFEGPTLAVSTSSSGSGTAWGICTNFYKSGAKSDSAQVSQGDSLFLTTDTLNTTAYSFLRLTFNHICKIDFFDKGIIQYSTDSGATWNQLTSTDYLGVGTLSQNSFSSISYTDWQVANSLAIPDSTWWKAETFNLDAAAGFKNVMLRFVLIDADNNGAVNNYGWILDDLELTASSCELNPPAIQLTGNILQGTTFQKAPFTVQAKITDTSGIAKAFIVYQKNNGPSDTALMSRVSGDTFEGSIPAVSTGDTVCYLVYANDSSACSNLGVLQVSKCIQFIIKANPPPSCIGATIASYDYSEDFSTFTPGNGFNRVGTLQSNWENASGDDHDWFVYDRATSSARTGPAADHSLNDANYLYIEATNHYNETANLITPCFDLTNLNQPSFKFWYHMYGIDMGELHLDVFFGGRWVLDIMPAISGDQGNVWKQQVVALSPYVGNTIKLRFRGITGNNFRSDIAIDDIEITDVPAADAGISAVLFPSEDACSGSSNESITVRIFNLGTDAIDSIPLAYTTNGITTIVDTAFISILPNDSADFTFSQSFNMSTPGSYSIDTWTQLAKDGDKSNDSLLAYSVAYTPRVTSYPDTSNFDNFITGVPGTFFNGWDNASDDDHNWYVSSGPTPTTFTGPSSDNTGSGNFIFMEASGINIGAVAKLKSKCYNIDSLNKPELSFYYHMLGTNMGELHLDLLENGVLTEDIIQPITGNQGNVWINEVVDLSSFSGTIKLIFRAIRGNGILSDIAIDDVLLRDALPVGIEAAASNKFNPLVYPNPFNHELIINLRELNSAQLLVFDAMGKLTIEKQLNTAMNRIDFSSLPSGIYFIRLQTASQAFTKKVIKN